MPRPSPSQPLRLFVAGYPPIELARELVAALEGLAPEGGRMVPPEQVHLTLRFIGPVRPRELDGVRESIGRAVAGLAPIELTTEALISLPEKGPARLVAVRTSAPGALLELTARLAQRLGPGGGRRGGAAFLPHMTLCRFGGGGRRVRAALPARAFTLAHVALVRSQLRPGGAVHAELERFDLAG
ncbi:MAG TPA: RNA 2',3'-cyclic phosphodiesterase [Phycisphaerales bacterium]|nr:RNA 2',3'-cyclic phosphodiesterase [Phycisphaerales bacterium]